MEYVCFASSSGGNCALLRGGGVNLLIDAGISLRRIRQALQSQGLGLGDVTAVLVTHDISEAISMSDRIVVLSHRPGTVRAIHDLTELQDISPMERRGSPAFQKLFNQIWEELDVNV